MQDTCKILKDIFDGDVAIAETVGDKMKLFPLHFLLFPLQLDEGGLQESQLNEYNDLVAPKHVQYTVDWQMRSFLHLDWKQMSRLHQNIAPNQRERSYLLA